MDRSMLARATEGTDAPTPGYLYVDLSKQANSNPVACQEMAQYLTKRLATKQNPNIKFKCCKVIGKLADMVPHFRRCVAQNPSAVSAIKEAGMFRGVPDPVRGDEPNQKVRMAAKEALDAVYRETPSSEQAAAAAYSSGGGGGMSGSYGSSPHYHSGGGGYNNSGGSGGGYGGGPRTMQGMGNPYAPQPAPAPSNVKEVLREAGGVIAGMIKDPLARNVEVQPPFHAPRQGHSGDLPGYNRSAQYGRPPPGSAELSQQTGGQWTMASNRGPGAIHPNGTSAESSYYKERDTSFQWAKNHHPPGAGHPSSAGSGAVGGSWGAASGEPSAGIGRPDGYATRPAMPMSSIPGSGGHAVSDGSYERNLILELCPPTGLKAVPPPDKLVSFAQSVPSLNSDFICPVLLDCIEEGQPWIIRAKALCVMETCLQSGNRTDGNNNAPHNPYRDFFYACHDEIVPLASHPRPAISEPAYRVLQLLGVANNGDGPPQQPHRAAPPITAPAPNLLDFDDEPAAPAPAAVPVSVTTPIPPPATPLAAAVPAAPGAPSSLFGGMQVKSPAPTNSVALAPPLASAPAPSSGDLLGDFTGAAVAAPTPDVFQQTPAAAATPVVSNQPPPPTSMFAQMSIKTGEEIKTTATPTDTTTTTANDLTSLVPNGGGSAFGFINSDTTTTAAAATPAAVPSFDPLKNLTPNSSQRKMMQLSPEQMQAMAYQQNMWQAQQMQQMQAMALAAASMGGAGRPPVVPAMMMQPVVMPMYGAAGVVPAGAPRGAGGGGPMSNFSFVAPAKKDDKKFDFVKDAMSTAGHKK